MPTPFMHLAMADAMLADPRLPASLRSLFQEQLPAFRLGHTAPDAQTVSGQPREATHFFTVPMQDSRPAHAIMFERHPELGHPRRLSPARAVFLTGYACHLALDQMWIRRIFQPVFGEAAAWATFRERLYLHNILRTHLDELDLPHLANGVGASLGRAAPLGWLPFLADDSLARWRDWLAEQLRPGASSQTVEVFARRMNRDPQELLDLLASPAELDRLIFARLPREAVAAFRADGLARSLDLALEYWEA
jgi:hypothetical protein